MESFKMTFSDSLLPTSTATSSTLLLLVMSHLATVEDMNVSRKQDKAGHITTCYISQVFSSCLLSFAAVFELFSKLRIALRLKQLLQVICGELVGAIRHLPVPLLPLSSTANLITVILSTINLLSLNYPVSSRSRTFLLVLS